MCTNHDDERPAADLAARFAARTSLKRGSYTGSTSVGGGDQEDGAGEKTGATDGLERLAAVIVLHKGERVMGQMRLGLVPHWIRNLDECTYPVNARAESLLEKPYFKYAVQTRRCLIVLRGFYEKKKVRGQWRWFYIRRQDEEPFAVAGLWER